MDVTSLLSLLESGAGAKSKRSALRDARGLAGLGAAFFGRIADRLGSEPQAARRLAACWPDVLRYGDERSYALRAKGVYLRLQGRWTGSAEAFQLAGKHASDPVDQFVFQTGAVDSLGRAGKVDAAVRLGRRLAAGLERLGKPDFAARVKLNVGNALLWEDRYSQAKSWLEAALPELERAGLGYESAAARLALSTAHLFGGSPAAAGEHAQEARSAFEALGLTHFAALAAINLAQAALLLGRPDEALDLLVSLRRSFEGEPFELARVHEFAATAYLALNLTSEASDTYRQALRGFASLEAGLNRANCLLGLGQANLDSHNRKDARACFARARHEYLRLGNRVWAAAALSALAQSYLHGSAARRALPLADMAVRELERAGSHYHLAEAQLTKAAAQLAAGEKPDVLLRASRRLIRRNGYLSLEWRIYRLTALSCSGRRQLLAYERMVELILEARLLVASTISRASFMRDKSEALSEYIALLLSNPTRARIAKALDVVRRTRSVALVDEVLSSSSDPLSREALAELERLREELRQVSDPPAPGQERRSALSSPLMASLQRRWIEARRFTLERLSAPNAGLASSSTAVLIETPNRLFGIAAGCSTQFRLDPAELSSRLKWLRFELLAPMADPNACPAEILRTLAGLRSAIAAPWAADLRPITPISPDAQLWQVPWQALLNAESCVTEPVLLPNACFEGKGALEALPKGARIAIWAAPTPTLPNVEAEVEALRAHFPSAALASTLEEVQSLMEQGPWDLAHVAGHASLNSENPMFSFVSFPDGMLFADDIARSPLRARHVCLSACDTGSVSLANKAEPDGLARAFLARGASTVLACGWPLDDATARDTMDEYYRILRQGRTIADSLREARSKCRSAKPHPYFWGCWVLFGGYD